MVQRRQPTSRRTGTGTGTGTGTRTSRIVVAAAAVVVVLLLPPSSLAAAAATGGGGGGASVAECGDDRGDDRGDPNGGDFRRVLTNAGTQNCIREECDAAWEAEIAKCRKAVLASASMSKTKSKSKSRGKSKGKQNKNTKQNGKKAKPSQSLRLSLRLCYKSRNNDKLDCIDACRASADDRDRPVHKKCKRRCVVDEKTDACMARCDDRFPATDKASKTVSFRLDRQLCRRECHRAVNRNKSLLACFRACNGVGSRGGTMKPKPTKTTRPNMMKKTPKPTDPPKETVTPSTDPFDKEDSTTSGTSDRYLSSYYGEGGRDDGTPTAAADRYLSNLYGGDGRDAEGEGSGEEPELREEQGEDAQGAAADEDVDIQFYNQMIL